MGFSRPKKEEIIYEDIHVYACLARFPLSPGHVVVVWKKDVKDLHLLSRKEYVHLMNVVDSVRDALLKTLKLKKVYLLYLDEANHVHWHLIPRYHQKGFTVLTHHPRVLKDFSLAERIREDLCMKKRSKRAL